MTRMQKWQSYREEIAKQSNIGQSIATDEAKIEKYKNEIDKINPAILTSVTDSNTPLQKGVTKIEVSQTEISIDIANMFATVNKALNTINKDKVENIFYNMKEKSILDKNKKFKSNRFERDKDYVLFKNETKALENSNITNSEEISKTLKEKHKIFMDKPENQVVDIVSTIDRNSQKQASHYVFVIAVAVSLLMLAIVLSLFIARMVLR